MRSHVIGIALATTMLAPPAWAQSSQTNQQNGTANPPSAASSQTPPPSANAHSSSTSTAPTQNAASTTNTQRTGNIQFVTNNNPNLWSAQKLDGVEVYNEQNQKVGDIEDVLLDRDGRVTAVVIGVGGFLGIGERDVAVSFNSLQWQMQDNSNAATNGVNTAPANNNASVGVSNNQTAAANANGGGVVKDRDAPAKAILQGATKDQLKNAPEFKYAR